MASTSPGVSKVFSTAKPRDLSLLKDPKILSATVPVSELISKKETLYLESLYDNALSPLNYASAVSVTGNLSSCLEVGLHVVASALEKKHWVGFIDPSGRACSIALNEAAMDSSRFVCIRNFSNNRFSAVLSNLVSGIRIIVAHVPTKISAVQMAKVMSRVRENNSILIFLDPLGLCSASFDRRIVAQTLSFESLNGASGVLVNRVMNIDEFEHGVKLGGPTHLSDISNTRKEANG